MACFLKKGNQAAENPGLAGGGDSRQVPVEGFGSIEHIVHAGLTWEWAEDREGDPPTRLICPAQMREHRRGMQ